MSAQQNEQIRVRVEVCYRYEPDSADCCRAEIVLKLQANENKHIPFMLRSSQQRVFGYSLTWNWGSFEDGWRYETKVISAKTWDELRGRVREEIDAAIAVLREVKARNEAMLAAQPADEVYEFIL